MNWRFYGSCPYSLWQSVISYAGGPPDLASRNAYDAAGEHSALALAMLYQESKYGTAFNRNQPDNHNPLNLRPPDGNGYLGFSGWAEGVRAWQDRLTDPTYKNGIYDNTITLADLIHIYAPSSDNNNEAEYVTAILAKFTEWGISPKESPVPTPVTFGRVPKPSVQLSHLPTSNPMIGYSAQTIVVDAVVWHRMIGTLSGTNTWFHQGNAATEYGIGVAATDGAGNAGKIIEWIDPANGHYYGESSGPVSSPYGDGLKFVNRFGISRVNPQTVAIEISGNYDTPLDDKARDAIANLTAYFADLRGIRFDEFPMVPGQDRSFVIWHQEFTRGTGKVCPGQVVMDETNALIERTAAIMERFQAGAVTPPKPSKYAPKVPVPGPAVSQTISGIPFVRATGSLVLKADCAPLQYANPSAKPVSAPYKAGRKIAPAYTTTGSDGKLWIVEKSGGRWPIEAFEELS